MNFTYKIFGLFLFFAVAMSSCRKDINEFNANQITPPDFSKMVNADFGGEILNELGQPMQDVAISIGGKETTTDRNGVFLVRDAQVSERKAYLQATKPGFFNGSRTMIVQEGKLHFATIQLLEKTIADSFESSNGGTIEFQGVTLNFPADGIKLKDGGSYSGNVNVAAKYLDPTAAATIEQMPGDLRGINEKGEEVVLATFGMMAVELIGDGGEELQVADGSEVEVRTPVPASYQGAAPATIPLWHFDEDQGLWVEEGVAALEGNEYVGKVSHFSFWNHDFPYPLVDIKGQVVDEDGNPIPNIRVKIEVVGEKYYGTGPTNDDGFFCGLIPKDFDLELTIYGTGPCNQTILYQELIGSFSENVTLDPIVVIDDPDNAITATVTGRLVDCDGSPVTNGYVRGVFNGRWFNIFPDDADGTFELSYVFCDLANDLDIQGYDIENGLQTDALTFPIDTDIQTGDLKACDQLDEYISYNLDGDDFTIPFPSGFPEGDDTYINAQLDSFIFINFIVDSRDLTGTFPIVNWQGQSSSLSVNGYYGPQNVTVEVTFTSVALMPEEFFIGTFAGDFDDRNGDTHTLSGDFRIKRKD